MPALAPLLGPGLIATDRYGQSPFLLVRLIALAEALRAGVLLPRWSPELAYGLGYPFFNFYAPLPFYLAALPHLAGLAAVESLKLVQAGGFVVASVGAFAWARRHVGDVGGLVAAGLYGYAPYHLVNTYARGDSLGEFTAMAVLPLLLLAIDVAAAGGLMGGIATAVAFAALVLSHNLVALMAAPLVALWTILALARARSRRGLATAAGGLLFGAGGTLFYWLPVLYDRRHIQLDQNTSGYFDFRGHFLELTQLVQRTPIYDYRLDGPAGGPLPFQLGLTQVVLVGLGAMAFLKVAGRERVAGAGFFGLAVGVGYAILATAPARSLWEQLGPLHLVQFPWRMLGPAALGLALVAALPARALVGRVLAGWALAAIVAAMVAGSLGATPERWRIAAEDATVAGIQRFELLAGAIGSTVRQEYLSTAVRERPWTSSYLTHPDGPVTRLLPSQTATVLSAERHGSELGLRLRATAPGPVVVEHHFFPGWRAELDGAEVPVGASDPEGYLVVEVPAGDHHLRLWFGDTRLRVAARWASLAALMLGLGTVLAARRFGVPWRGAASARVAMPSSLAVAVGGAAAMLFVVQVPWNEIAAAAPPNDGLDRRFAREHAPWPYIEPRGVRLGPMEVAGYRQEAVVTAGQEQQLEVALRGDRTSLRARIVPPLETIHGRDRTVAAATVVPNQPTARLALPIPPGTPAGLYQIELSAPEAGGSRWLLAPFRVVPGPAPPPRPLLANFGGQIALEGLALAPGASAAEPRFDLRWRALATPADDWRISLRLVDAAGHLWGTADSRPADGFYPTRLWSTGEMVTERRDVHPLVGTPPGRYQVEVRLYSLAGKQLDLLDPRGAAVAPLYRSSPVELPPGPPPSIDTSASIELVEARLGATQAIAGSSLPLSLLWRAGPAAGRDLDVLLALGPAEQREPASRHFAASAWRSGEVVRGQHDLLVRPELPAGEHLVRVSLLDAATGNVVVPAREIGRVRIDNRPRRFTEPQVQHRVGARFADQIELIGFDLPRHELRPGERLEVTLYWRAIGPVAASYTVFTHLLDGEKRVRGQVDAVPGNGRLPTNGWAPGEVVEDRYEIPLEAEAPTGRYELEIGLYDARTGVRLPVGSDDHLILVGVDARP